MYVRICVNIITYVWVHFYNFVCIYIICMNSTYAHMCIFITFKNWIGNERAKRKRVVSHEDHEIKPPQKIRMPNCFNLFTADFYKSDGMYISLLYA